MWASLSEHARLFAVDLPGFGASEHREDLLSPRAMGELLAQLIAEADLGRARLLAPDVGTAAGRYPVSPVARLVVGAHTAFRLVQISGPAGPRPAAAGIQGTPRRLPLRTPRYVSGDHDHQAAVPGCIMALTEA
jgi:hypothetical protein